MASSWQSSHYIVLAGAAALAFGAGYMTGSRPARPAGPVVGNNMLAPAFPGFETNEAAPPPRRSRPDENELIAENAEREDGQPQQRDAGQSGRDTSGRGGRGQRRGGRQEEGERMPPDDIYEQGEQDPYGPEE